MANLYQSLLTFYNTFLHTFTKNTLTSVIFCVFINFHDKILASWINPMTKTLFTLIVNRYDKLCEVLDALPHVPSRDEAWEAWGHNLKESTFKKYWTRYKHEHNIKVNDHRRSTTWPENYVYPRGGAEKTRFGLIWYNLMSRAFHEHKIQLDPCWHDFYVFWAHVHSSHPGDDKAWLRRIDTKLPFGPNNFHWYMPGSNKTG